MKIWLFRFSSSEECLLARVRPVAGMVGCCLGEFLDGEGESLSPSLVIFPQWSARCLARSLARLKKEGSDCLAGWVGGLAAATSRVAGFC